MWAARRGSAFTAGELGPFYENNEQFTLRPVSSGVYQVVAQNSGLCLAPAGDSTANDAALVQVSCTTASTRTWAISQ